MLVSGVGLQAQVNSTNRALVFDKNTYLELPINLFTNLDELTVEMWVKFEDTNQARLFELAAGDSRLSLGLMGGRLRYSLSGKEVFSRGTTIKRHVWYHVAGVFGWKRTAVYVNGMLREESLSITNLLGGFQPVAATVGRRKDNAQQQFLGQMDELRIWNYARSSAQILESCETVASDASPGLLVHHRFDEPVDASPLARGKIIPEARLQEVTWPALDQLFLSTAESLGGGFKENS